jgi:7-cyano-7-deazaguanine synthase in queuosine biosynthesis
MIFNIIVKSGKDDEFSVTGDSNNKISYISSYRDYDLATEKYINHSITTLLNIKELLPSENAIDFINLSLAIYTFDQLVPRETYGYFNWNRYFKLFIPVVDIDKWNDSKNEIEKFISFLSGDKWEIEFRSREKLYDSYTRIDNNVESVCLFSGGLDSFIGAVDLLEQGVKNIAFVSHHKMGISGDKSIQQSLVNLLEEEYPESKINANYFYVQAKKDNQLSGESTQRARSIIFIALALAVANSYGNNVPIYIPENGLISLNVPLTKTRYGSHSTKTTHPYFISELNKLFRQLGLNNEIINPYRFSTKGEMITKSNNSDFIKKHAIKTVSCSKAGYYKQWSGKNELHCGHCTPCIIRRSSMKKAGIDSIKGEYVRDVLNDVFESKETSSRDLIAFKIALSRLSKSKRPLIFELMKSGSIPANSDEIKEYVNVYKRGMEEVNNFLFKKMN